MLVSRFVFFGKIFLSGRRESNKLMVLILELRDLLKTTFLLVQTLNQVQGDGGIEVPEALEGWSLSLSKGASCGRVRLPAFFWYEFIYYVRI